MSWDDPANWTGDEGFPDGPGVTLEPGVEETVRALYLDGDRQAAGTWGSSASAAEHKDDDRFAGAGVLMVRE